MITVWELKTRLERDKLKTYEERRNIRCPEGGGRIERDTGDRWDCGIELEPANWSSSTIREMKLVLWNSCRNVLCLSLHHMQLFSVGAEQSSTNNKGGPPRGKTKPMRSRCSTHTHAHTDYSSCLRTKATTTPALHTYTHTHKLLGNFT